MTTVLLFSAAFGACNSTDVNNTLSIDTAGYNAAGNNAIVVVNLPTMLNPLSRISWFRDEKYFDFKKECKFYLCNNVFNIALIRFWTNRIARIQHDVRKPPTAIGQHSS